MAEITTVGKDCRTTIPLRIRKLLGNIEEGDKIIWMEGRQSARVVKFVEVGNEKGKRERKQKNGE